MLGPASLVSAYSTIGAIGAAIMPTPMVALEALAWSIIDFCLSFIFMSGGRHVEDMIPGRAQAS